MKNRRGFLAEYSMDDAYLLKPNRALGRAGILRARNTSSLNVLVKFWPRKKNNDDSDLEDIWRSEIRQLQRLAAVPRADDLFVHMITSGKDKEGFYLVLDPGPGSPLEGFLRASKTPELLAQARQPQTRRILWANARRLAEALELLHSQGAIHRNLDPWAVVTTLSSEPDFRITGFEWSMRIAAVGAKKADTLQAPRGDTFSFARDWRDLALLFALFLDIPNGPLGDLKIVPSRVADHASAAEIKLLRTMLGLEPTERLDGEFVCRHIDEILDSVSAEAAGKEAQLSLSVRLGRDSRLSEAIRRASDEEIEINEEAEQIRFVVDDLGPQTQLVQILDAPSASPRFALVGSQLTYRLAPYRQPQSFEAGNWEFAYCERADDEAPVSSAIVGSTIFETGSLDILRNLEATQSFPRRRGKTQRWEEYLRRTDKKVQRKSNLDRMHRSFSLLLVLEMAYAAADVFPVKVISKVPVAGSNQHQTRLVSRHDEDRARLSDLLMLDAPAVRLGKMLAAEDLREESPWVLSEPGALGERGDPSTSWRFLSQEQIGGIECYVFEGNAPTDVRSAGFLAPADMAGGIAQFKRRLKALAALREHAELLRMLVDPRIRIEESQDPLNENTDSFKQLDPSKQGALREILSTIPLFLLQGPPGVGKTYLVGDVVRRRFDDEPTTRILLSAQSNSAIDHLMSEVKSTFANVIGDERPLMVRARAADDDDSSGDLEIDIQTGRLLRALAGSLLVSEASVSLRDRVVSLANAQVAGAAKTSASSRGSGRQMSSELRALEAMILRAANLVFATTNSYAVERLIEERSLFDWTIIEEAGKATGGELLSPLLLSHRRLMIGDHKQLPPFGVEKMTKLLALEGNVRNAVGLVDDLISRYLKDPGIDEIFREVEAAENDFGPACADTMSILTLFETFVERELTRQKNGRKGTPIARRLAEQYRMHPAIARVVSSCFYEGSLITNNKIEKFYAASLSPIISADTKRLPELPLVFIDMPYSREEQPGGTSGDRAPPWSNPDEVKAVIKVLEQLRARESTAQPTLAVLSPYRQQVKEIRMPLLKLKDGVLAHLSNFKTAIDGDDFCGTVDSFQGGEADAVIVSLVRNNHHANPARALGFLRDNRRMNVLLSRAKWRLILIGSLSFYRSVVATSTKIPDADVGFLTKFLDALDAEVAARQACIIPWPDLSGLSQ
jgi:hypothetical protein